MHTGLSRRVRSFFVGPDRRTFLVHLPQIVAPGSPSRVVLLFWDGSGLWCCAKRFEKCRFPWPAAESSVATLRGEELLLLLAGLEVREKRGWYRR